MIIIESKRKRIENILRKYPDAVVVDVTSNGRDEMLFKANGMILFLRFGIID